MILFGFILYIFFYDIYNLNVILHLYPNTNLDYNLSLKLINQTSTITYIVNLSIHKVYLLEIDEVENINDEEATRSNNTFKKVKGEQILYLN
jgi:hypothetical protein